MVRELTLRQVGGSIGATIPKDLAERLHLEAGDRVLAVETDRGILVTPCDPDVEAGLAHRGGGRPGHDGAGGRFTHGDGFGNVDARATRSARTLGVPSGTSVEQR